MKLNIGCGRDRWGDIRLDVGFSYRGNGISPNFIGDAQNLPFRNSVFSEVKASHIIEEIPFWRQALDEWMRVCNNLLIIKFPLDDGFKRMVISCCLNLDLNGIRDAIKCRKLKCHYWIINPKVISGILQEKGFKVTVRVNEHPLFMLYGRKGRLLRRIIGQRGHIKIEYEIMARKSAYC